MDVDGLLAAAAAAGATKLLLLPSRPPMCRVRGELVEAVPGHKELTAADTDAVAATLLTDAMAAALERGEDHVERPLASGVLDVTVTVFRGLAHHHLVFHIGG